MAYMAGQLGGYSMLRFTKRDLYNYVHSQQRARILDRDAATTISYLEGKANADLMSVTRYTTTADNRLGNLFWVDSIMKSNYELFGDVLAFDATYHGNKYKKPLDEEVRTYRWVLLNLLDVMGQRTPNLVVTDGDKAMRTAIAEVMPSAKHRLCAWHLEKNCVQRVKEAEFWKVFKKAIYANFDVDEEVKKQIKGVATLLFQGRESISTTIVYSFSKMGRPDRVCKVLYDPNDQKIECECKMWDSDGIPCSHIFCVMKYEGMEEIPETLIFRHWCKIAKDCTTLKMGNDSREHARLLQYSALYSSLTHVVTLGCEEVEDFAFAQDAISDLNIKFNILLLHCTHDAASHYYCTGLILLFNKIHQSPFQSVLSLPMPVADGTRMKGVEADIKKLYQMIEMVAEENRQSGPEPLRQ
ncbi:uncharacterized protein [Arachis hypogaea]|uniref:uncharacterized protein n=1 Tax=Arachis hypogaea TaxID=3818 RepID=UPI003B21F40F